MSFTHKGRHCRPSKTGQSLAAIAGTGSIAGIIITASPAMAATVTIPGSPPVIPPVTAAETSFTEVVVHSGNSLSELAGQYCHDQDMWTGWYNRNKRTIGANPDSIQIGQKLVPDCRREKVWLPHPAYRDVIRDVAYSAPAHAGDARGGSYGNVSASGYSGIESCIITRESGGQSQVMNSSGHYGLFQFDYGTWVSGGGSGADFGHASVGEQQRVYENVYAARGAEPWAPSDGC